MIGLLGDVDVHGTILEIDLLIPLRTGLAVGAPAVTRLVSLLLRFGALEVVFENEGAVFFSVHRGE